MNSAMPSPPPRRADADRDVDLGHNTAHDTDPGHDAGHDTDPGRNASHKTDPGHDAAHNTDPGHDTDPAHDTDPGHNTAHDTEPSHDTAHNTDPGRNTDPGAVHHASARGAQAGDTELLQALASPATYPGHPRVTVHETHASWVFVVRDRAYKIKKPLRLGFLDYSTLERRREACREEVLVNHELAPDIYLGVRAIVRTPTGYRLTAEDALAPLEYAVEMRRFRERDTLAGLITTGSLTRRHVSAVAHRLAEFHRAAPVIEGWGPERMLAIWRRNVQELEEALRIAQPDEIAPLRDRRVDVAAAFGESFVARHELELRSRGLLGLARDGHGDLRCEHVLVRPTIRIIDRIEFDPHLRHTDVACDLAFLAMDLETLGQRSAAHELYGAYGHAGISPGSEQLRSFYAAHWALVRAKVALIGAAEHERRADLATAEADVSGSEASNARKEPPNDEDMDKARSELQHAQHLLSLSERLCWRARRPVALVICGPAASGKSTLAAELARRSEMPVVSSDAVRKRLAGVDLRESARPDHYTAAFTRATYEQLGRDALSALRDDDGVIVDATCRSHEDRRLLLSRLGRVGMTLLLVRCTIPLEVAIERATRRLRDPHRISDATPQIVERQFREWEEPAEPADGGLLREELREGVLRLDTTRPLDAQVAEVAMTVDRHEHTMSPRNRGMP